MIWLLRIEIAGRTWYLASRGCSPEEDGVAIPHHGTLEVGGFAEGIEIGGGISGPCSASVAFHLGDIEAHDLVLEGHDLADAFGEVSLWEEGTSYAVRHVLVYGPFQPDGIAERGQNIEGEIAEVVIEKAAAWPPADAVASEETWSTLPSADETAPEAVPYPFIFGFPGPFRNDGGVDVRASASPAIIIDDTGGAEVALVAGHAIGATSVRIWTEQDIAAADKSYDAPVTQDTDALGRVVSVVALSGAPATWTDFTVNFWATDFDFGSGGGIAGLHGTAALASLGDAIELLLTKRYDTASSQRVDSGAWAAIRPVLAAWRVGFYTSTDDGDPIETIADRLIARMCPNLWLVGGPRGVRPIFLHDTPVGNCPTLTEGRDIFRSDEPWSYAEVDPINAVTVSWALRARTDELRATVVLDRTNNVHAASGYGRAKRELAELIEVDATYDRGTAALVGAELLRTRWTRPIVLVYDCPADVALGLELGQRIELVDEDEGITSRLCWIMCRETEDGEMWSLTLMGLW